MNVLIIIPNTNLNKDLKVDAECREIQNCLFSSLYKDRHSITILPSARLTDIRRCIINIDPDIIHICGHSSKTEGIVFEDKSNSVQFVDAVTLRDFFSVFSNEINTVLFNSCYSGELAQNVSDVIKYTIGFGQRVSDDDAIEFAIAFYDGIFNGFDVESSFALAQNSLKWTSNSIYPDPVLYSKFIKSSDSSNADSEQNNISIAPSRLPIGNYSFLGRESEIEILNESLSDSQTNLVFIEAWGGVGKTALVSQWRNELLRDSTHSKENVTIFDWSFFSQGLVSNRPISTDLFFKEAFKWFGITDTNSVQNKGEVLALHLRKTNAIIILDGLESMQYSDNIIGKEGEVKDSSLRTLISMLCDQNQGLCVITSRKKLPHIDNCYGCKYLKLPHFTEEQSLDLLDTYDLKGSLALKKKIYTIFSGHALSLNLVATFIRDALEGNIAEFFKSSYSIFEMEEMQTAKHIMQSYEKWYGIDPHIKLLRLVSLFDRPASRDEIRYIINCGAIDGLTDSFYNDTSYCLNRTIRDLKRESLISEYMVDGVHYLDSHPLVREYFNTELSSKYSLIFEEGNNRLYKYFSQIASSELDNQLALNNWFRAVYHGCLANKSTDVFETVYLLHMKQNEMIYDARKLGGNSTNLNAISAFFSSPWTELKSDLRDNYKSAVYAEASFALRSQGLMKEAIIPLKKALEIEVSSNNYIEAAMQAGNLSELFINMGMQTEALEYADKGVTLAELSNEVWRHYWVQLAKKADVLSKLGKANFAKALFNQAENVQKMFDPEAKMLYGVLAYKKFDMKLIELENQVLVPYRLNKMLRLTPGEISVNLEILKIYAEEIQEALNHDKLYNRILHIALDDLITIRIDVLKGILLSTSIPSADKYYSIMKRLVEAGRIEYYPYAWLLYSTYCNLTNEVNEMSDAIDKIEDSIYNCNLSLLEIDVQVERCYYYLATGKREIATKEAIKAKETISKIGYLRKLDEVNQILNFLACFKNSVF